MHKHIGGGAGTGSSGSETASGEEVGHPHTSSLWRSRNWCTMEGLISIHPAEDQGVFKGEDHLHEHGLPPVTRPFPGAERSVSIREDVVVKVQEPEASRRERLRTLAGGQVGRSTGLFVVPEIVSFDDSRGEIVFERLSFNRLPQAISDTGRSFELVGRAGAALASIHQHMESCDGTTEASGQGMGTGSGREAVPLHGDFGMRNVFYLPDSNRLAVIDWSNADWIGVKADLGAPEIDLTVFLTSLFHRRLFGRWPISRRHELARHFLTTYAGASPHGVDIGTLRAFVAATSPNFNQRTRRRKGSLRALAYRYGTIDLYFFLRRLSGQGFPARRERQIG